MTPAAQSLLIMIKQLEDACSRTLEPRYNERREDAHERLIRFLRVIKDEDLKSL